MQASPPETTDTVSPKAFATAPASRSPSRGPPATTAVCTPISRPRIPSGPANWMIVLRNTAENTSAAPATASSSRASGSQRATPKAVIDAPQASTATTTERPCRLTRPTQPLVSAPSRAPAPGAAYSRPTVVAPPPKTVAASAGNSARGMPNTIAFMSIRYAPSIGWDVRTNRSPSSVDRHPGRAGPVADSPGPGVTAAGAGCGDMVSAADTAIRKLSASIQ